MSCFWKVQLWLGQHLIEEHIAPSELAQGISCIVVITVCVVIWGVVDGLEAAIIRPRGRRPSELSGLADAL